MFLFKKNWLWLDIGIQNFLDFRFGFEFWNPNPKNIKTQSEKIQNFVFFGFQNFWIYWIPKFFKLSFFNIL